MLTGAESSVLSKLEKWLTGNGREGLIPQVARIEEKVTNIGHDAELLRKNVEKLDEKTDKQFMDTMKAITELTVQVTKLTGSVEAHHKSLHLKTLLGKPKFYAIIIGSFVVLHLVATYIPNFFNIFLALSGSQLRIPPQ